MRPIWTLNARESIFLDVMESYSGLSDQRMRREILSAHASARDILTAKGVDYDSLKNALIPQSKRRECAFIFDRSSIDGWHYGYNVAKKLIPLMDRNHTCSILHGDLIDVGDNQEIIVALLDQYLVLRRSCKIAHTAQLYCVYLNNLTNNMFERIDQGLSVYDAYIGYIDVTYSSIMKDYLSSILGSVYLKAKNKVICQDPDADDLSNEENVNTALWPIEQNGYECISLQSMYYNLFLSYKIERAILPGFENDTKFSLNTITDFPRPLSDCTVVVDEGKRNYLASAEKAGSFERAGIENMTALELERMITSKIAANYIYSLNYRPEYDESQFNIMLEIVNPSSTTPTRLMCGLKYKPDMGELHVITMF